MDESDKTMIGKIMPLLNECQRKAFLSLYYEKLGYESTAQIFNLTGMSLTTLTALSVRSQNSRIIRTPAHMRASWTISVPRAGTQEHSGEAARDQGRTAEAARF